MVGCPRKFTSVKKLQKKIDSYFASCWDNIPIFGAKGPIMIDDIENPGQKKQLTQRQQVKPYTITGLANALELTRQGLLDYENRDEFADTIKRAKGLVEQYAEEQLFMQKNATGAIFNLKNNYGWKDKTEQELTVKGSIAVRLKRARERRFDGAE